MSKKYGNEQVGISAEIAIGDLCGVAIAEEYRRRGQPELIAHISPALVATINRIPKPTKHIAADQNPVDFLLTGGKTLSVKSNMKSAGKIAPQKIGQPTSSTFWELLPDLAPEGIDTSKLSYAESAKLFKKVALSNIAELLTAYWESLFDCDHMIYVYNVIAKKDQLSSAPTVNLYGKLSSPIWVESEITFTQSLVSWNESCTVKYYGISIGEFQVHNNRDCFKFRMNFGGLMKLGLL